MNIPTPSEIMHLKQNENEIDDFVEKIINDFIYAVKNNDYHYTSTEKQKEVFYPAEAYYCKKHAFEKAEKLLIQKGWNVKYCIRTCGRGWYNSIIVNVE